MFCRRALGLSARHPRAIGVIVIVAAYFLLLLLLKPFASSLVIIASLLGTRSTLYVSMDYTWSFIAICHH
jgi:hypothetical protein